MFRIHFGGTLNLVSGVEYVFDIFWIPVVGWRLFGICFAYVLKVSDGGESDFHAGAYTIVSDSAAHSFHSVSHTRAPRQKSLSRHLHLSMF